MSRRLQLGIILLASTLAASAGWADECKHSAERANQLDVAGARQVEIRARAGSLRIDGRKGGPVQANGLACASSDEILAGIELETRREGDVVLVNVRIPDLESIKSGGLFGSVYASLDLTVLLPDNLPVKVTDSSGEADIRAVASLDVTDSSGDLRIRDITGNVRVRDSSGEIVLRNLGADLLLADSSGNVHVSDVAGKVEVEVDSSGDLDIERVRRDVHVLQDSSGSILVTDVDGSVRIDRDGSGDIDVRRVKGKFTLGSKGSGDVREADIGSSDSGQ